MPTIDYALAHDFIDPADTTIPYRLEFQHPYVADQDPHPTRSNPAGQLRAVVKGRHPHRGTAIAISRLGVHYNSVQAAIGDTWPWREPARTTIDLAQIRERVRAAGLD
ncbi:hypothetical protein [Mycolicibacterium chlorophenolicum]|uniref:Uncharacterized protein n=1 Tax=Mycolicibacterium chlorophenolicum TaxID=37916 RepID=A0A0J6VK48_9MYCO|nr:hypothetical protein [Mycolicibacterium chlorophenolicum]KMO69833.1 hypothetical protein MCHLDSM_05945 [Mycolicibacterium chlorophenolicum]